MSFFLNILLNRSTLLASLVAVEYEAPMNTFQDLFDNNILMTIRAGKPPRKKYHSITNSDVCKLQAPSTLP